MDYHDNTSNTCQCSIMLLCGTNCTNLQNNLKTLFLKDYITNALILEDKNEILEQVLNVWELNKLA